MKYLTIIVFSFVLLSCSQNNEDLLDVTLDERRFVIPIEFLREAKVPLWLHNLGLDDSDGAILLTVKAEYMKNHLSGYQADNGNLRANILLYLSELNRKEVYGYLDPGWSEGDEIWFAKGWYKSRVVEKDGENFRVYPSDKYREQWALLSIYPDSSKPLPKKSPDFLIGKCHLVTSSVATAAPFDSCKIEVVVSTNLLLSFEVWEPNMHLIPEIKRYLTELITSWEVK